MGVFGKPYRVGIERKQKSFTSVVKDGYDHVLEDECRALQADDELRVYWVDKCLSERTAARLAAAARQGQGPAAPAAPPAHQAGNAPPPAHQAGNAPPPPPADEAANAPPANGAPAAN